MADPLQELHATIRSAADALRDGAPDSRRADAGAPAEARAGRLLDERRDAARAGARAGRRARSPSGCARSSARASGRSAERIEVAGPGFVNVFLADRWYRESLAAHARRGRRASAAARPSGPSGSWSSSCPPTRPGR